MPRWLPLAGAALLAILVVIGLGLWKFERLQEARIESGGRPAIPACAPDRVGDTGLAANCPGTAFPPAKAP
ncbi:hypothetical protein ASF60_12145 [Methylobacterium sp. Leaf113]|uniref:hypothetical protein n=1 Tax=Methylobacterium sp. Leaf113 TaxID=1736259 RepID=UPI0006FB067C|nr:hypothetical protein [Methylobacterium sp. Leaf113]KQP72882.1 hypothetical protein ASF60_12145 [Methylobacterium sp. Leaf113]